MLIRALVRDVLSIPKSFLRVSMAKNALVRLLPCCSRNVVEADCSLFAKRPVHGPDPDAFWHLPQCKNKLHTSFFPDDHQRPFFAFRESLSDPRGRRPLLISQYYLVSGEIDTIIHAMTSCFVSKTRRDSIWNTCSHDLVFGSRTRRVRVPPCSLDGTCVDVAQSKGRSPTIPTA